MSALFRIVMIATILLALPTVSCVAQSSPPTPASVLGFEVGADFELASYVETMEYFDRLAAASDELVMVDVGTTSQGRSFRLALISSAANLARLDEIRADARALARASGLDDQSARAIARDGVAVVHIDGGMHTDEAANAQHTLQLAYELLLRHNEPDVRRILDEVLLILWPTLNPDGLDNMVAWYEANLGTPYEIAPMPFLYQEYVGHDNNRDAYMLNMIESRVIAEVWREYEPQVMYCQHQTSPFPTRIWLPPFSEPIGLRVHPLMTRTINSIGMLMAQALEQNGQVGAMHKGGDYDVWYPGYADYLPNLRNCAAFFTETALHAYATPGFYTIDDFPQEYRDLRNESLYASPWKGGWWRLRDAVDYMVTCSLATLEYASKYREDLLYNRYLSARQTIERYREEPPFAYFVPADQRDPVAPIELLRRLAFHGVEVYRLTEAVRHEGREYATGTWVIPMDQAFAELVRALFDVQTYPDIRSAPEAPFVRPYDATGWTLPYLMDVRVHVATAPLTDAVRGAMSPVIGAPARGAGDAAPFDSVPGVGFDSLGTAAGLVPPPGRSTGTGPVLAVDASQNNAFRAVNRAFAEGAEVSLELGERAEFRIGGLAPDHANALVRDLHLRARQVAVHGRPLARPRIGVYRPFNASIDEGWTRWLLEQYEFEFSSLRNADLRAEDLGDRFDVVLLCNIETERLDKGFEEGEVPPRYSGGLGDEGARGLERFVEGGGTLVCLGESSRYAIDRLSLPVTDVLADLEAEEFFAGGTILEVLVDPAHPVMAGMPVRAKVYYERGPVFAVTEEFEGAVLAHFADHGSPRLSGLLHGEEHLLNAAAALDVRHGDGRVILFGFRPQWRGQTFGTFRTLFQALLFHGPHAREAQGTPGFGRPGREVLTAPEED